MVQLKLLDGSAETLGWLVQLKLLDGSAETLGYSS
jgi:hypothetical protein